MSSPTHIVIEFGWRSPTMFEPHYSEASAVEHRDRLRAEAGEGIRYKAYRLVDLDAEEANR